MAEPPASPVVSSAAEPVGPGLWGRLVLALAALLVALVAGYALVLVPALRRTLLEEESEELEIFARLVAEHVDLGVAAAFHELEDLAGTPALAEGQLADVDAALARADGRSQAFLFHYLVGRDGRILARPSRQERVGEDRLHAVRPVVEGAPRFASDVWTSPLKHRTITLAVPVRASDGRVVSVLTGVLGLMDRNQRLYRFITDPPDVDGYEVALATQTGQVLATQRGAGLGRCGSIPVPTAPGISHVDDEAGHWLVASARVESVGWWVMARVPEAVLQRELRGATGGFVAVLGPFFVVVFLAGVVVTRRLARRLEALTSALTRYGRDGRAAPVVADGRDEVAAAGRAFNRMLEERDRALAERERLEERLRQAARMETVGRFAAGVAHDMNNLLTPILSYAELAQTTLEPGRQEREWLTEVVRVGGRARDLVQQVLAYGRAAAPRREPLELAPLIEDVLRTFEGGAPAELAIERDLAADVSVVGDAIQLQQVALNLLTNAAQAISPRDGRIVVRLTTGDQVARLSVEDSGPGMDEATRARVFEPFFTTRPQGVGTGLGLAIVQGIVAAHGGQVHVKSAPGQGTTFEVLLPLRPAMA